jgi:outer membrane protein assembly factor BamB
VFGIRQLRLGLPREEDRRHGRLHHDLLPSGRKIRASVNASHGRLGDDGVEAVQRRRRGGPRARRPLGGGRLGVTGERGQEQADGKRAERYPHGDLFSLTGRAGADSAARGGMGDYRPVARRAAATPAGRPARLTDTCPRKQFIGDFVNNANAERKGCLPTRRLSTFERMASVLCLLALSPIPILGQDRAWPQFRGPDANPVATNARLADRWSKTDNVEWSQEIPGRGWSSPIVTGDKIFLTTVTTEGASKAPQTGTEYSNDYVAALQKQGLPMNQVIEKVTERDIELPGEVTLHYFLYCLSLTTGKVEWQREFHAGQPPGGRHRKNSFSSESPVTDGTFVYVYVANLGLWAFDLEGKQVWKTPLEANPIYLDFGTGSSPALIDNLLVIVSDNERQQFIAAFDKHSGTQAWRTNRDIGPQGRRSAWVTPYVWKHALRTEIVAVGPEFVVSYDLAGKELWRMSGMSPVPVPTPFARDGLLYVNGGRGAVLAAVRPGARGDISLPDGDTSNEFVVWSHPRAGSYLPSSLAYEGGIYALTETGILTRFDARTGKQTYKTRIDPAATAFTASPWAHNGTLFCLSEEGETFVIAAGDEFKLLHTNALDDFTLASPALVDDRTLIRTEHRLYSIRRK